MQDTATLQPVTGAFVEDEVIAAGLKSDLENIYTPPNFAVNIIPYWVQLNKNALLQILTTGIPNGVLNYQFLRVNGPQDDWKMGGTGFITSPRVDGTLPGTKPGKAKAGVQEMGLLDYLLRLLETWQAGISVGVQQQVPQRWQEALALVIQHYEAGKVSPTQVYAWLNSIDLSKRATTI